MLLGSLENKGESFIDVNAHQKIRDSFKQAVIYEKYANPIKDEQGATYQSVIKQLIVDCTGKTIAIRGADYFAGKTSNSKLVKKFDDITLSHDGETGAAFYSFDDLEFKASLHNLTGRKKDILFLYKISFLRISDNDHIYMAVFT